MPTSSATVTTNRDVSELEDVAMCEKGAQGRTAFRTQQVFSSTMTQQPGRPWNLWTVD